MGRGQPAAGATRLGGYCPTLGCPFPGGNSRPISDAPLPTGSGGAGPLSERAQRVPTAPDPGPRAPRDSLTAGRAGSARSTRAARTPPHGRSSAARGSRQEPYDAGYDDARTEHLERVASAVGKAQVQASGQAEDRNQLEIHRGLQGCVLLRPRRAARGGGEQVALSTPARGGLFPKQSGAPLRPSRAGKQGSDLGPGPRRS